MDIGQNPVIDKNFMDKTLKTLWKINRTFTGKRY